MNYSELTRRYFDTAEGAGVLEGANVGRGAAGRPAQGTWVQFDIAITRPAAPGHGHPAVGGPVRIAAARFLAYGCPHTIAVAAWLVEQAPGQICRTLLAEPVPAIVRRFDVPVEKLGRLLVVEDAWAAAAASALARVTLS